MSLPVSAEPHRGSAVQSYFDNLLPDSVEVRARMQAVLDAESTKPFDLLSAAGADCVGALSLSTTPELVDVRTIDAMPVSDADIADLLRGYRAHPLGMTPDEDDFRISIAGAQDKTAFLWHRDSWHRPRGATPTTHIFKLPLGPIGGRYGLVLDDSVENEWLCLRIAAAFGLPVPDAEISHFDDVKTLVVKRFDRRWSQDGTWLIRLPQEDACQALGVSPGRKYESDGGPGIIDVMDLLQASMEPAVDRAMFLRANIVYWLLAATDGHAKNFSFFLFEGGRIRLAPVYDVLSAYPYIGHAKLPARKVKMAMAVRGKNTHYRWSEIEPRHFVATARRCGFSPGRAREMLDDCASRVEQVIDDVGDALPRDFPATVSAPIFEGLRQMKGRLSPSE